MWSYKQVWSDILHNLLQTAFHILISPLCLHRGRLQVDMKERFFKLELNRGMRADTLTTHPFHQEEA